MGFFGNLLSDGVEGLLKGAGLLAKDLRSAFTGDVSPEDKAALQSKVLDLEMIIQQLAVGFSELQSRIIIAETQGGWLQRNWRPILMLSIVSIVVNNYIVYPYLSLFGAKALVLELPDKLWNLMQIGVGGYIVGRSAEKVAEVLKK